MGCCKLRPAFLAVRVSPDGSPLAVFRASYLTSSIPHKQALLMFKYSQRTSQTDWRKSEVSHGTQGLPHSSSLNIFIHITDSREPGNPFIPKLTPLFQVSGPLHMTFLLLGELYPPLSHLRKSISSLGSL